ncbi:MAG: glutathione peroxidase [Oceanospirillaceae bacterium]|nr:glutathione peroxidase [Oceanospirillaceae bacterium]
MKVPADLKIVQVIAVILLAFTALHAYASEPRKLCSPLLNYEFKKLGQDERVNLCDAYQGKLILVVNTASKCAYTPQYNGLESMYEAYKERGLVVLGFPSNDFAGQEPGTEKQISNFCRLTYGVKFPMFEKVHAAQRNASLFYQALAERAGEYPGWNFHKYLIAPNGQLVGSFKSNIRPDDTRLMTAIEAYLPE